jgi:hypothetical protein
MAFAFEVLSANELSDQEFTLSVSGVGSIDGVKGSNFLITLGLDPSRSAASAAALAAFYVGAAALAFAVTALRLRRRECAAGGGGAVAAGWRSLAARLRGGAAPPEV